MTSSVCPVNPAWWHAQSLSWLLPVHYILHSYKIVLRASGSNTSFIVLVCLLTVFCLLIDREARDMMYLVASVCLSIKQTNLWTCNCHFVEIQTNKWTDGCYQVHYLPASQSIIKLSEYSFSLEPFWYTFSIYTKWFFSKAVKAWV